MMPALSAKTAVTRTAFVIAVVVAASQSARAVNDSMTALNNNGDVAFVESPGEDVNDNAGISLKIIKNGTKSVLMSNGDPLRAHCFGGDNPGDSCNSDVDCPNGGDCVRPVVAGFAKRICMNDSGLVTTRVGGVNPDGGFRCEDGGQGSNSGATCNSDADCTGGGTCTDDPDTQAAIVTVGLTQGTTVLAQTCDTIGSDVVSCPDPAPDINNAGQVAFTAEMNSNADFCDAEKNRQTFCQDYLNNPGNVPPGAFYAMYRFTPGTGIEEMLRVGDVINASTVTVVDQEHTDQGEDDPDAEGRMNAKGQMLTLARYDNGNINDNFLDAVVLLNDPGNRTEIAREGIGAGNINELEKGVLNSATATQVLYKAIDNAQGSAGSERLVLFTQGNGSQTIATEGDSVSNGGTFNGFGRFFCLNDVGQAAFVAGLNPAAPATGGATGGSADVDPQPQGLYFWNNGTLTEIARTEAAGGTGTTSFNGFEFEWLGAAVVLNDAGTVCFFAEHVMGSVGDNEPTAVFCWDQATGLREIYRDGVAVAGSTDTSFVPPMQTFKRILNESGQMAFVVDPTGSQDENDDNFVLFTTFLRASQAAPALSWGAMVLAVALIVGAGIRSIRRRRAL